MAPDFLREIAGPAGPLEALLDVPEGEPRAVAVFGHPHPLHGASLSLGLVEECFERAGRARDLTQKV